MKIKKRKVFLVSFIELFLLILLFQRKFRENLLKIFRLVLEKEEKNEKFRRIFFLEEFLVLKNKNFLVQIDNEFEIEEMNLKIFVFSMN